MAALQAYGQPNKQSKIYYQMTKRKPTERRKKERNDIQRLATIHPTAMIRSSQIMSAKRQTQ